MLLFKMFTFSVLNVFFLEFEKTKYFSDSRFIVLEIICCQIILVACIKNIVIALITQKKNFTKNMTNPFIVKLCSTNLVLANNKKKEIQSKQTNKTKTNVLIVKILFLTIFEPFFLLFFVLLFYS